MLNICDTCNKVINAKTADGTPHNSNCKCETPNILPKVDSRLIKVEGQGQWKKPTRYFARWCCSYCGKGNDFMWDGGSIGMYVSCCKCEGKNHVIHDMLTRAPRTPRSY